MKARQNVTRVGKFMRKVRLEALSATGAYVLTRAYQRPVGAILRLQRVRPPRSDRFQPNRAMEITPNFLNSMIAKLRRRKVEVVSLDEIIHRLIERDPRGGVCFTCDGGYVDHSEWVYPIFRKHDLPFAAFVPTGFVDQIADLWWLVLEAVIRKTDQLALVLDGADQRFECRSAREKTQLFEDLSSWLWERPSDDDIRRCVGDLAARYEVDLTALRTNTCMGWDEIATLAADPLVTIGAQTIKHPILAKLPEDKVRSELAMSRAVVESAIGVRPDHLVYPFGDDRAAGPREFAIAAELGFKSALTSRPGVLLARHRAELMALPRVTLDGEFQRLRYLPALLAGLG